MVTAQAIATTAIMPSVTTISSSIASSSALMVADETVTVGGKFPQRRGRLNGA
ncbi:hypothetical protein [Bosea sp. (in: a-proteobacteria)]|uniref:hypothetical protein n=1 Tax=Bosea sp. (in: a-proteobacteria) TaxID=1871050 RepID=UPI003B3BA424